MMEIDRFPTPHIPPTTPVRRKPEENDTQRNTSFRNLLRSRDRDNAKKKAYSARDLGRLSGLVQETATKKNRRAVAFPKLFSTKKNRDATLPSSSHVSNKETNNYLNNMKHPYASESESKISSFRWSKSIRKSFRWNYGQSKSFNGTSVINDVIHQPQASQIVNRLPRPDKNFVIPNLLPSKSDDSDVNDDNIVSIHSNMSPIGRKGNIKDEDRNEYVRSLRPTEIINSREQSYKKINLDSQSHSLNNNIMDDENNSVGSIDYLDKYLEIAMTPESLVTETLSTGINLNTSEM